ncbi:L-fuculose phosphate aldolase [Vibrio nigripulchritudo SO65]|uniref:L-fuculose-phosphate aldolase n=1 Tax=Vibrio nigripulchritudo TaxID=28173 RepID=UPI0003B1F63C|nr:L-fuculose-phosphate aldolase [Vibrio nigripulchritudo]CCN36261.1 L-fuculose phosphate aldolase [Vibrio nigripulchritudo AM115]CCN39822.1 L-fuculose phosphate aldolase [Vibrio nigripulchritudo FTn2]CCN65637.1 L-fuculose phosphate aldolase [Vibrio nigripulchritudo POn4]CCN74101.1 L-fuculose phosphate aldolase [Vibrio nigripulchritudo SO65]
MTNMIAKNERALRQSIIDACISMNSNGLNQGTSGNISVRYQDGILITPTSLPYDEMSAEDIVWMGFDGVIEGDRVPSTEWRFHIDIMRQKQDVNAIVHAHPTACTTLSIMNRDIPPIHYMVAVAGGHDIRCAEYATFGVKALSNNALKALEGRKACLLAHHGMIATAQSLDKAMWLAIEVEALAKQYLGCLPMGEPPLLSKEEIQNVINRMTNYGHGD